MAIKGAITDVGTLETCTPETCAGLPFASHPAPCPPTLTSGNSTATAAVGSCPLPQVAPAQPGANAAKLGQTRVTRET
jgi:hypothetical protein